MGLKSDLLAEVKTTFSKSWDAYHAGHRNSVNFVHELEDLRKTQVRNLDDVVGNVREKSQEFIDVLV